MSTLAERIRGRRERFAQGRTARRTAKDERYADKHAREAERLAGRTDAEARRHGKGYGGY
jgi:hypothetical protein